MLCYRLLAVLQQPASQPAVPHPPLLYLTLSLGSQLYTGPISIFVGHLTLTACCSVSTSCGVGEVCANQTPGVLVHKIMMPAAVCVCVCGGGVMVVVVVVVCVEGRAREQHGCKLQKA